MSISMHIDEYMARRGIIPDDTVITDNPCEIFDGRVESTPGQRDSEDRLDDATDLVRDILGESSKNK